MPEPNSGCWLWLAARDKNGYGVINISGKMRSAYRAAYEDSVGPVPVGLELDHLCRVRCCVNPAHLEAVTHQVNQLRGNSVSGVNARKTHCVHGHLYTPESTYRRRFGKGCRICHNARRRVSPPHEPLDFPGPLSL